MQEETLAMKSRTRQVVHDARKRHRAALASFCAGFGPRESITLTGNTEADADLHLGRYMSVDLLTVKLSSMGIAVDKADLESIVIQEAEPMCYYNANCIIGDLVLDTKQV